MGKAAKRRMCPAIGREITSADCGDSRGSRHSCPDDCEHNPLSPANYGQLLEIEDELDRKTLARMFEESPDRPALERAFRDAVRSKSAHAAHAFTAWQLFFQTGAEGRTFAQRWEQAGFPGLKNDERVLFRAKMQTRVALLEIRRVIDEQHLEAVDLFAPGSAPLRLLDRSLARQAVRFASFLTWTFPLPHFCRLGGTAIVLPDWSPLEPVEIVVELVRHLGGPAEIEKMPRWLAEHFVRLSDAVDATAGERRGDIGARLAAQKSAADPALVPPRLLEHLPQLQLTSARLGSPLTPVANHGLLAGVTQAFLKSFADAPVPALNGRTPSEAARDPMLRPVLVRLLKAQVRRVDEENLRTGRADDINWLLRDLGLDEINVPPPPVRLPAGLEAEDAELSEDGLEDEFDDDRLEPDPLPDEPLDLDEAVERMDAALEEFDTAEEALDELELSGSTLVTDVDRLTADLLDENEFSFLVTLLLQVWFALVQPGCRAPELRLEVMAEALEREMKLLEPAVTAGPTDMMNRLLAGCRQPALLQMAMARLFSTVGKTAKKMRPSMESQGPMVVVLKVVINELDYALR